MSTISVCDIELSDTQITIFFTLLNRIDYCRKVDIFYCIGLLEKSQNEQYQLCMCRLVVNKICLFLEFTNQHTSLAERIRDLYENPEHNHDLITLDCEGGILSDSNFFSTGYLV